jgi:LPS export ABC transporter permease LptG
VKRLFNQLDRYVVTEIHLPFLLAMLVYNGIFFIRSFIQVAQLGGDFQIPFATFFTLFLSFIPEILYLTIPMSFLFGSLAAVARLSSDSELIAPQAAGMSFWRLNRPIALYGLVLSLFCTALAHGLEPAMKEKRSQVLLGFMESVARPNLNPGVITNLGPSAIFYVDRMEEGTPSDLLILAQDGTNARMTFARTMELFRVPGQGLKLRLLDGTERSIDISGRKGPRVAQFNRLVTDFPAASPRWDGGLLADAHEYASTPALLASWRKGELSPKQASDLMQRVHFPFACLALSFFALPLAGTHVRLRRGSGFAMSLLLVFAYFLAARTASLLVEQQGAHAGWTLALPNIGFLLLGLFLLRGKNQLKRNRVSEILQNIRRRFHFAWKAVQSRIGSWQRAESTATLRLAGRPFRPRSFPSRLDRYLLRQFLVTFLLVQGSILGLIQLVELSDISKMAQRNGVDRQVVWRYLLFRTPELLETSLFLAALIAVLVTLSVMSRNQEVTAVRAGGGSLRRLCLPLLIAGLFFSGIQYYLANRFLPGANRTAIQLRYQIKNRNPGPFHKNWIRTSNGDFLHFEYYNPLEKVMLNTVWYEVDYQAGGVVSRTQMDRIHLQNGQWVTETAGSQWRFTLVEGRTQAQPAELPPGMVLPLEVAHEDLALRERRPEEFSIGEYRAFLEYIRGLGVFHPRFPTELYAKWSQPLLPLLMMMLAAPLGFQFGRRGTFFGLATGLVLGLLFWGLFVFSLQLGRIGLLPPAFAAWSMPFLFGMLALYRFLRMEV